MIKKGSIVTGKSGINGTYGITNEDALMVVTSKRNGNIKVIVLATTDRSVSSEIGYEFVVDMNDFHETDITEWLASHPNCVKLDDEKIAELVKDYTPVIVEAETTEEYVLPAETRTQLIAEMKNLLEQYNYAPTEKGLGTIVDEWAKNKGWLIKLFEKHPNYNGRFQIVFSHDFDREIDKRAVEKFAYYLRDIYDSMKLEEVVIGKFTYRELRGICRRLYDIIQCFSNEGVHTINGRTREDYISEYKHFSKKKDVYEGNPEIYIDYGDAYTKKSYENKRCLDHVIDCLCATSHIGQFVDDTIAGHLYEYVPGSKIKEGQKYSRAFNKCLTMLGIDKMPNYNKEFAKFADAVNPLKIKRHTIISIHPIDYYTMSFGNSWASCHTIDKTNSRGSENHYHGEYSSGTESYMLDETSMVFYTVNADYNGNQFELQDKMQRNMFHYYDNQLVQGRVYPQSNDDGHNDLYKDIREIVQKIMADLLEVPNIWTIKKGTRECSQVTDSTGTHYQDYTSYSPCNVSTLKDGRSDHAWVSIGHYPICPVCGKEHSRGRRIECYDCHRAD